MFSDNSACPPRNEIQPLPHTTGILSTNDYITTCQGRATAYVTAYDIYDVMDDFMDGMLISVSNRPGDYE